MSPESIRRTAAYCRLSREDGDKPESDSILHQQYIIEDYCSRHPGFRIVGVYADDGATGTNFNRDQFRRMLADIEAGKIDCVIVKDLSRFGRDYIDTGYYLERYFPEKGVRFIAIGDGVDSDNGPYDMLLPLKNVFNAQYAKDISGKVRSAFKTKQSRGEFCGAFACYGYLKDPENKNHLIVDPVAAEVVRRVFRMAADGVGQVSIAKALNADRIPCPSDYKRMMGMKYTNGRRLAKTCCWTYSTIHKMLRNELYTGTMVSNRSVRPSMHSRATAADKSDWIVVPGTHEPVVSRELWDAVQAVIARNARAIDFRGNVGLFAGFLRCGDCGRSLTKTTWRGRTVYSCGSYHRYGASVCTSHYIREEVLCAIVLSDLNRFFAQVGDWKALAERSERHAPSAERGQRLQAALERIRRLKQGVYEDYRDKLLSKEDYLRYQADYAAQEEALIRQLEAQPEGAASVHPWAASLFAHGGLTELDRTTLAQAVEVIRVFEGKRIEITYRFSEPCHRITPSPHAASKEMAQTF
ncbi:MAG: recombinase family protein [Oscillospiraceae bacterium]|nr:recombinase family protein [Oscillospiraceae bacterium]